MRAVSRAFRASGESVGLVPTMGYLHAGHLSLVREARERCERVIVSIYVNPTQFGENEDLDSYPRDLEGDMAKVAECGADIVFSPSDSDMYPAGYSTFVEVQGLTSGLCGASRPTHFRGVTTIVTKLFNMVEPDVAVFGRKDYQQLAVLRRMTTDLNLPVEIVGMPIVREPDGLALSSRNAYLNPAQREAATALSRALEATRTRYREGERSPRLLLEGARALIEAHPELRIDYAELVEPDDLAPLNDLDALPDNVHMALAVFAGTTRLIDNSRISE